MEYVLSINLEIIIIAYFCSNDGSPIPPASPLGSLQPDLYQRRDGPVFLSARRYIIKLGL